MGTSADQDDENAPRAAGYDEFWATLPDRQQGTQDDEGVPFFHFWETRSADPDPLETEWDAFIGLPNEDPSIYLTNHMRRRAATWINEQDAAGKTWFAYVPFLAPHKPWGCPREGLGAPYTDDTFECDPEAMTDNDDFDFRSMITAVDIEIDRLLNNPRQEDGIEWDPADTLVIITSDNGSPTERVDDDPFSPGKAKGSVAQGGVWVPLVIGGAGVTDVGQRVTASVSLADPTGALCRTDADCCSNVCSGATVPTCVCPTS